MLSSSIFRNYKIEQALEAQKSSYILVKLLSVGEYDLSIWMKALKISGILAKFIKPKLFLKLSEKYGRPSDIQFTGPIFILQPLTTSSIFHLYNQFIVAYASKLNVLIHKRAHIIIGCCDGKLYNHKTILSLFSTKNFDNKNALGTIISEKDQKMIALVYILFKKLEKDEKK
jgi:hypothetical protein